MADDVKATGTSWLGRVQSRTFVLTNGGLATTTVNVWDYDDLETARADPEPSTIEIPLPNSYFGNQLVVRRGEAAYRAMRNEIAPSLISLLLPAEEYVNQNVGNALPSRQERTVPIPPPALNLQLGSHAFWAWVREQVNSPTTVA